jgi:hypothetical protein
MAALIKVGMESSKWHDGVSDLCAEKIVALNPKSYF